MKKITAVLFTFIICSFFVFGQSFYINGDFEEETRPQKRDSYLLKDKNIAFWGCWDYIADNWEQYSSLTKKTKMNLEKTNWDIGIDFKVSLTKNLFVGVSGGWYVFNDYIPSSEDIYGSVTYGYDDDKYRQDPKEIALNGGYFTGQLGLSLMYLDCIPNYFFAEAGIFCGAPSIGFGWEMSFAYVGFGYSVNYFPSLGKCADRIKVGMSICF